MPESTGAAREMADARGIDLNEVEGSGEGGRVLKADVQAHSPSDEPIEREWSGHLLLVCPYCPRDWLIQDEDEEMAVRVAVRAHIESCNG